MAVCSKGDGVWQGVRPLEPAQCPFSATLVSGASNFRYSLASSVSNIANIFPMNAIVLVRAAVIESSALAIIIFMVFSIETLPPDLSFFTAFTDK